MEAAHIIPFLLNDFSNNAGVTFQIKDAARTWDMLQSWTTLDLEKLVGSKINSSANAIFMTADEHDSFGKFRFYLDEQVYPTSPNKYKARMVQDGRRFSDGQASPDVEFRQVEGVEPPDPEFLRVHAAFAKVLNLCGAAEYIEIVERDAESTTTLRIDGTTDFGTLLMSRLPIVAY
ncbi:hypothetical protein B0H11DRAFT_2296353 [Mycena galericulata]|nr:hypothetical protein B0H11DRAFT_2296353 [Mycena galericulata]